MIGLEASKVSWGAGVVSGVGIPKALWMNRGLADVCRDSSSATRESTCVLIRIDKSNVAIAGIRDSPSFRGSVLLVSSCEHTVGFYDVESIQIRNEIKV